MSATPAAPGPMPVAARRKMRKGTHSCNECRRRKIKCKFPTGNTSSCIPCAARGSRCLDQRDVAPVNESKNNVEMTSLRERVAVLEDMVKLQSQRSQDPTLNLERLGLEDGPLEADERAPFVSMLNNSAAPVEVHPQLPNSIQEIPSYSSTTFITQSSSDACLRLRSSLPPYDVLMSTLSQNGAWWSSFRHKTQAICQGSYEGLVAFAAHAYTSSSPAELGMLVAAYARSTGQHHHLYRLVESVAVPDSAQSYSAEVMELLLLLAKAYSDIGQPRQSWLMYRKGLAISEVMGLYRREMVSPRLKSIWWAFYHGDRFSSLLLGLPYGFNDAHFGPSAEPYNAAVVPEQRLVLRCASIAGKIIDRTMMPGKPSSASSMLLDEQMDTIASSMPLSWWDVPDSLPSSHAETDELRNRLLLQYYFFHVRINLHLPFVQRLESTSSRDSHRLACMEASRQLLTRFLLLRTQIGGHSIFDCKTSDFVGFMAAVALILCLSQSTTATSLVSDKDRNLIARVKCIFEREEKTGCIPFQNGESPSSKIPEKIAIPYFGYIRRDITQQAALQITTGAPGADLEQQIETAAPTASSCGIRELESGSGSSSWQAMEDDGMCWEFGVLDHFQVDDLSSWLDIAMLDVDPEFDTSFGVFPSDD
ncbi:hypothetical protein FBEOM_8354 [Fusarium beomiforme]|uniref:Zn(2)-C6 fungal-type domain-containing protein n=1 Tax=Fusarium beomiforme TaxID=44412 RepID=A0A9P5AFK4_9HYPO|nr:hypothetical protein FBEOM_8354 [Fusarium beomiforme]